MIKTTIILIFSCFFLVGLDAQYFSDPITFFSKSKNSYVILKDGNRHTFHLMGLEKTKGLIKNISFNVDEEEIVFDAAEIAQIYLLEQGYRKHIPLIDIQDEKYATSAPIEELLENGYTLFQYAKVELKGEKVDCLLQILNPYTSELIAVYHDPLAALSTYNGGTKYELSGGTFSSYYIGVGEDCFRVKRKKYPGSWKRIFAKCPDFISTVEQNFSWKDLGKMINAYNGFCEK